MRTVHLLLFVLLLVCQTTESLTDKQVNLGQNVTLDCQIDVKDIFWLFQKLTDSPVVILQTFSSRSTIPHLYDERFKDKYSSLNLSRLFIGKITIDELGIYYCVKTTGLGPQLSNGTRLDINFTESVQDHNQQQTQSEIHNFLTVKSFLLNIVLIIAIIVLLIFKRKPTKCRQHRQNVEPEQLEDFNAAQFSAVKFCLSRPTNNTFDQE